ncbi:epoxide hydrolase 1 [Lepeophtheirus salmonis]|nr:epoxide hydrolase 1-like [Lepeophtheirus salmonis]
MIPQKLRICILQTLGFLIALALFIPLSLRALFKGQLRDAFKTTVRKDRPSVFDSYGSHRYLNLPKAKIKIHVVDSESSGKEDKPLMLFVHGFPDFWYSFRHQIKYFSSKFRCVSVDNRGYNESDKPNRIQDYSVDQLASDIKEVVELLGYDKCVLVGHDWGGSISYRVCAMYPEIVSVYISLNIPHYTAFFESLQNNWSQKLASWYMLYFQCPILPEIMINAFDMKSLDKIFVDIPFESKEEKRQDIDAYKYVFSQPNALTGPINYYRCAFQYPLPDTADKKSLIKVPVCSIYGNGDRALLREGFIGSAKYVEDFTLKELDGISHWVHLHAKDEVNRLINEYIDSRKDLIF